MEDYRLEQTGQEVQRILNGAAMEANLQAEVERATDAEGTLQENIDAEAQARQDADGLLQQGIDDEAQRAKDAEEANAGEIEGIKALIPSTASEGNKLADTDFVNSSIQTATAEYRGDYNVVTDLHLAIDATHAQIETLLPTVIAEADKNDYCYVMIPTSAQTPTEIAKIERYKMTSEGWKFEYDVNNSTFTAEEWAAIKSGITSGLVAKLNALPTNADLLLLLAGKQDVLTFDSVPVPESNNPVKSGGVYSAIDDEKTARLNSDTAIHAELDGLQAKVPATASSDNKLVDQNQMNSSISTATATFRGDWNVVSDLHLAVDATRAQIAALLPTVIATSDNNDYCYVEIPTSAETPTQIERVERYKYNGTAWAFEYVLNNSGFTAAQWAAINSMITSGLVAKLTALPTNTDLIAMLAQKQNVLTFDPTPTENSTNPVTSGGVFAADKALSDAIEAILLLIPSAASALNKLVDTSLMNSSISTATATFRGTYNLVSNLGLGIDATEGQIAAALLSVISTADNNDYTFVQIPTSAETPAQIARTDRYKFNGTDWAFEYTLNTSGFTAAQWAAINSTITSALVAKLNALPTAAELQEALGTLTSGITAINQKIPSTASQSNKLVDNASMESYIAQVINILDASFNVTSIDGHITLHITQVDGVITSVQVQSTDIASAADLALKASQADLAALASRVTTSEGNITSLTGRMGTAETNIANLQQLYNNLQQSKPVPVTTLPTTGQQQGVIYRLAGTNSYSDYMWNGSTWVLMATYDNAIDDVPTVESDNLVKSGGVFSFVYNMTEYQSLVASLVTGKHYSFTNWTPKMLNTSNLSIGDIVTDSSFDIPSSYDETNALHLIIDIDINLNVQIKQFNYKLVGSSSYKRYVWLDKDYKVLYIENTGITTGSIVPVENAKYLVANGNFKNSTDRYVDAVAFNEETILNQLDEIADSIGTSHISILETLLDGKYWNSENQQAVLTDYASYSCYAPYEVEYGRTYYFNVFNEHSAKQHAVLFVDESYNIIESYGEIDTWLNLEYTVTNFNIKYILITTNRDAECYYIGLNDIQNTFLPNEGTFDFKNKNVAIIGDSISTNGNLSPSNPLGNVPEIVIQTEDVGVTLSAYITWGDVYNDDDGESPTGKTVGGHAFTQSEIGTEVSFTPTLDDVGKYVGVARNSNPSSINVWWEIASKALGFNPIPVCWSGSSMSSHNEDEGIYKTSYAWHDAQIRKCGIRGAGSMSRIAPDVIIVCKGTNDFSHTPYTILTEEFFSGSSWNYPQNDIVQTNKYGFLEAISLTVKKLRDAYPEAKIVLCTLNYFKRMESTYPGYPTRNGLNTLMEYNNAIREAANWLDCNLIEFDKDGITYANAVSGQYYRDADSHPTHPNDKGHIVLGNKALKDLINQINSMT